MLAERGNKIYYVEPGGLVLRGSFNRRYGAVTRFGSHVRQVADDIHVITAPAQIPFYAATKLGIMWPLRVNRLVLKNLLLSSQHSLKIENPILWTYFSPSLSPDIVRELKPKAVVYDCTDNVAGLPGVGLRFAQIEAALAREADIVFVTSKGLLPRFLELNANTHFAPNGVDFDLYSKIDAVDRSRDCSGLCDVSGPIIGYVGSVYEWMDLDLIYSIGTKHPGWTFVIIGPVHCDIGRFRNLENVRFLGKKVREEAITYLKHFDVCVNVFRENELTKYVHPLKVYEYLAAGKPVVSVPMSEIDHLRPVVKFAANEQEFTAAIEDALAHDNERLRQERLRFARRYSWDKILDGIWNMIDKTIQKKANRVS